MGSLSACIACRLCCFLTCRMKLTPGLPLGVCYVTYHKRKCLMNVTSDHWEHHSQPQKYAELPSATWTVYLKNFGCKMNEKVSHIMNYRCATHEHMLDPVYCCLVYHSTKAVNNLMRHHTCPHLSTCISIRGRSSQEEKVGPGVRKFEKHLIFCVVQVEILVVALVASPCFSNFNRWSMNQPMTSTHKIFFRLPYSRANPFFLGGGAALSMTKLQKKGQLS